MKKLFVILLSAVLIFSMIGTAYAGSIQGDDESNPDKTATSKVSLTLTDSYTITIPDVFDLDEVDDPTYGTSGVVDYYSTVESIKGKVKHIADDSNLVVTVNSTNYDNGWYLKKVEGGSYSEDPGERFRYYMRVGDHVETATDEDPNLGNDGEVLTIHCDTHTEVTVNLHVKLFTYPTIAGVYEDILTFKASVLHE